MNFSPFCHPLSLSMPDPPVIVTVTSGSIGGGAGAESAEDEYTDSLMEIARSCLKKPPYFRAFLEGELLLFQKP